MSFRRARAPRRAGDNRLVCYGRALYKREAALFRCKAMLPRASPGPHLVRWLARVARLRDTALALCWEEAQHARFRRARAPRHAGDNRLVCYRRALYKREAALFRCKAMLSRVSAGPHLVRWLAHVARLPATALALSREEAQGGERSRKPTLRRFLSNAKNWSSIEQVFFV